MKEYSRYFCHFRYKKWNFCSNICHRIFVWKLIIAILDKFEAPFSGSMSFLEHFNKMLHFLYFQRQLMQLRIPELLGLLQGETINKQSRKAELQDRALKILNSGGPTSEFRNKIREYYRKLWVLFLLTKINLNVQKLSRRLKMILKIWVYLRFKDLRIKYLTISKNYAQYSILSFFCTQKSKSTLKVWRAEVTKGRNHFSNFLWDFGLWKFGLKIFGLS